MKLVGLRKISCLERMLEEEVYVLEYSSPHVPVIFIGGVRIPVTYNREMRFYEVSEQDEAEHIEVLLPYVEAKDMPAKVERKRRTKFKMSDIPGQEQLI